ncbi:TOMM precursor leader peptide-binding protein [Massilia frigida]|nr:TOMM precursor leader peptide-binding protein [Massilia frigida]
MFTNTFELAASNWHTLYLQRVDARHADDAHVTDLVQRRLSKARVSLIVDSGMAVPVLHALKHLQLGHLCVAPLDPGAMSVLAHELPAATATQSVIARPVFDNRTFTLGLYDIDLVAVALTRPHPQQLASINAIAVRHGIPVCPVLLDGARVELGPTVMPGASACLACAEVRSAANAAHIEAWEAERQFHDRNPGFEAPGRFDSLARVAASMLALEISALIGGARAPAAVNRLVSYDLTTSSKSHPFIPYYEWCQVCRPPMRPGTRSTHFEDFLLRRKVKLTRSTS